MTEHTFSFRGKPFAIKEGKVHPAYSIACFAEDESEFRNHYWNVKDGDVVVDAGASYGAYTLTAAAVGALVHAFEPEPRVFVDLWENNRVNHFPSKLYCAGLSGGFEILDMAKFAPHWPAGTVSGPFLSMPLDALNLQKLDWMKVDVEGWERQVLAGARETILRCRPNIIVECHQFMDENILARCKRLLDAKYDFEEVPRDPCIMLVARPK